MQAITEADFPQAAALLHEGFQQQSPAFWLAALRRIQHYSDNAQAGEPVGWFMLEGSQRVGVVLTLASLRRWPDGRTEKLVNFSSWYVRPEHRWRAFLKLRKLLADDSAVYTDLTPTAEVQAMLRKLNFSAVNAGVAVLPLPLLALGPAGGARVQVLAPEAPWPACALSREQVESHRELGCLPVLVQAGGHEQLVICRRTRWRGLPVAQLVYAESLSQLLRHRVALARCLLGQGFALFVHDARQPGSTWLSWFRRRDVWFFRGADLADRCDAFASELCIVHADVTPPVPSPPLGKPPPTQPQAAPPAPPPGTSTRQGASAPAPC
jgi:hypothetical protein